MADQDSSSHGKAVVSAPTLMQRTASSPDAQQQWLQRVNQIHGSRIDPEARRAILERAETTRNRERSSRRAFQLQSRNVKVRNAWSSAMTTISAQGGMTRDQDLMGVVQVSAIAMDEARAESEAPADLMEMVVGGRREEEVLEATDDDITALLEQLRVEPTDQAEVTAKFMLYEKFLESVEAVRRETFAFWEECKGTFGPEAQGAKAAIERSLRNIDTENNMGFAEVEGRWFVYDMTMTASKNSGLLHRLLSEIKTKLELLGRSDDCPICLNGLSTREAVVLGCCHKVCADCWTHWASCAHPPFCPICKHEEFTEVILSAAAHVHLGDDEV